MKKALLITVSAVFFGILVMLLPQYLLCQIAFPDESVGLSTSSKNAQSNDGTHIVPWRTPSNMPFYMSLVISLAISLIVYAFLKRHR